MKDVFGVELYIGDEVAVAPKNYRGLVIAKIVAFTPKQVRVEYLNTWNYRGSIEEYLVPPNHLVKNTK